jgi:iron(III) transport system permease protein
VSRWAGRLLVLAALGVAALALVVPVGTMLWRSIRVEEVVTQDGRVWPAVGEVHEQPDPNDASRRLLVFATQSGPGAEKVPQRLDTAQVRERREVFSLAHYRFVFGDERTRSILVQSLLLAVGSALLALLLGLPVAWALSRCAFFGRRVLAALSLGPLLLPAFVLGMGAARPFSAGLERVLGLSGRALQMGTAMLIFAATLYPVVVLLVGRAWAAVPAGPHEAARLLRGPRAAWRLAVLPALKPALAGSALVVVLLALADFAVPDLMSFLVPGGTTPMAVFAKEVQYQWKQEGNEGRAVATGAPLLLLCLVALVLALVLLRKSPLLAAARTGRVREPRALSLRGTLAAWLVVLLPLTLGLGVPLGGILSWAGAGGWTVTTGSKSSAAQAPTAQTSAGRGSLGDFSGALDRTPGSRDERDRWLKTALAGTLLTLAVALVLARWGLRGGRAARAVVGGLALLALAAPGVVVGLGTLVLWSALGAAPEGVLRSALALTARFLPLALLGVTLALREVRRGYEEAAATLGAGPGTRALQVTLPLAGTGIAAAALLVLVLALREIDAVVLLETRLFPLRIYDKVHYSQWADEANLTLLYLAWLLVPALGAALLLGWKRRGAVR